MTVDGIDRDRLERYLQDRWPERPGLRIEKITRIVGGMSRRTHFVDLSWESPGGRQRATVNLRTDHPALTVLTVPLSWEFEILTALRRTSIPVAEPYWYETDPELIGVAPFYLREVVPGSGRSKPLFAPGQEARRAALGRQVVEHLATLHTLDWREFGFERFMRVPDGPADCYTSEIDHWEEFYGRHAIEPSPIITEIFGRLRREQPRPPDRISLIWGDVGIGQFIYDDDRVVALTDFEMSRLGDPMMDLAAAFTRGMGDLLPREEVFELYEERSGISVDLDRIDYCTMLASAACFCWHPLPKDFIDGARVDAALTRLGSGLPWQWALRANSLFASWNGAQGAAG